MSWEVLTNQDVDRKSLGKLFQKHGIVTLQPIPVTRMEVRRGLRVHRDPELCFVVIGPDNLPELLEGNNLVNAVLESPKVRAC